MILAWSLGVDLGAEESLWRGRSVGLTMSDPNARCSGDPSARLGREITWDT